MSQTKGIGFGDFDKKFGVNFKAMFTGVITDLEKKELVKMSQNRCALTSKGMLYQDSIAAMFI